MNSIANRIISLLLFSALGLLGAWSVLGMINAYRQGDAQMLETQRAISERLAYNLAHSVWNLDREAASKIIQYETSNQALRAVLVYDESAKLYAGFLRKYLGSNEFMDLAPEGIEKLNRSGPLPVIQPIAWAGEKIGTVQVYVSESYFHARVRWQWASYFLQAITLIAVLTLLVYYGLRHTVIHPLIALKDWASIVGPGHRPPIPVTNSREINALANSFSQMATRLASSEEWHRVLFEQSQYSLLTLSPPSWRFTAGNPASLVMFGLPDQEALQACEPWQLSPPNQPDGQASTEKARETIELALREGSHYFEWIHRRANGEDFPVSVLLVRIEIQGQLLLHATVRDQSDIKRMEASLAQSERLASMGLLAAGVAHEINNPLAYVMLNIDAVILDLPHLSEAIDRALITLKAKIGEAEFATALGSDAVVLQGSKVEDVLEQVQKAAEGAQRIQEIVRSLSSFSRMDDAKLGPVNLMQSLHSAASMAHNQIKFRASLNVDVPPLPPVQASLGKLTQVFLNLLVNAAHAIEVGRSQQNSITVRAWQESESVLIEISDTGKGISPENLVRIWDPFFTTKKEEQGTGLGLAICRSIIEEFKGQISVSSQLGQGSCFTLRLLVDRSTPRVEPLSVLNVPVRRGRVLVIDDEDDLRDAIQKLLAQDNEVLTAATGQLARQLLEVDSDFDLLLCDLMMPDMSGIDLHAWLLNKNAPLAGRMVFMTGGAFSPKARDYIAGLDSLCLEKPFEPRALQRLVAEFVSKA